VWEWSKDRNYEREIEEAPYEFKYQSVHYIVRCRGTDIGGVTVAAGTPCEVQVRTLLQHAHSELTHDTIYKPTVVQTADMHRAAAKAMALIEATNDYFEQLMELIETSVQPNKELSKQMAALYRELVGVDPDPTKAEGLLNDAYAPFATDKPLETTRQMVADLEEQQRVDIARLPSRSGTSAFCAFRTETGAVIADRRWRSRSPVILTVAT
jgi:putative GTP pyrophosphokinase